MSGTYGSPYDSPYDTEPTPAEQHLGDRLAALVDGELGHETRERVLAHLATCRSCKAEADAQRRLKSVFADAVSPPPSERLLARLQGLPAGLDDEAGPDGPRGPSVSPWDFEYLPSRSVLSPERGFRVHEPDRGASRGRRFAFAAAGAVSLAAFAIGGALTSGTTGGPTVAAGGDGGTTAGAPRTAGTVGSVRNGGRTDEGGREEAHTFGAPTAEPTPAASPTQSVSRLEAEYTARQYGLMTVPVLDVTPTLHPPLIRPTPYAAQPLELGPTEPYGAMEQPLVGTSPSGTFTATLPASEPGPSATPAAPGR
ncbi:anti-sigma factor family protein [Streptomyces macrosporus]|uniref:Zf-HC2 domain-containing protein n=1 Tax=Streptomyces macrosporus TaxID=44032 RepID=A0ABN3KLK4_9ACTN